MSRNDAKASFSPMQRKACLVLAGCVAAVIVSFVAAWILPGIFLGGEQTVYDPQAYPLDTTLSAILPESGDAGTEYIDSTVFVGDENTIALTASGDITLDRYVGAEDLVIADLIRETCVYFQDDPASYTIPQAIAMMKPRRVIVTLGGADVKQGTSLDAFLQDYRQVLSALSTAYQYCDIIVGAIPPVNADAENAAARQTTIDQFNQGLAQLCQDQGYRFLNSTEVLKASTGFAEGSLVGAADDLLTSAGVNTYLQYVRTHAWETEDRRPDTDNIPRRAEQPAQSAPVTPSPTPLMHTVSYGVKAGSGTLTYDDQKGVNTLRFEVADGEMVTVTAVPDEGYTFTGWSDGLKEATRVDKITGDVSVSASFSKIALTLDQKDTTITLGSSLTINADVTVDGMTDDNSGVVWSLNGTVQTTAGSYTFTPEQSGTYTITATSDFDGAHNEVTITVTVSEPATSVTLTVPHSMQAGSTATLTAEVENGQGETIWSCAQMPNWTASGSTASFTPTQPGRYYIRVTNNDVTAEQAIEVTAAPEATASPTPAPDTQSPGPEHEKNDWYSHARDIIQALRDHYDD